MPGKSLGGLFPRPASASKAQEAAWAAPGIVHVENDLLVVP